jgi:hypothetical protein
MTDVGIREEVPSRCLMEHWQGKKRRESFCSSAQIFVMLRLSAHLLQSGKTAAEARCNNWQERKE